MGALRHIPLEEAYNVRDLGGYSAGEGRATRWGILLRGDSPSHLTVGDWSTLGRMGIATIIDLRSDFEARAIPVAVPPSMSYVHISLMREVDELPSSLFSAEGAASVDPEVAGRMIVSMTVAYGDAVRNNIGACAAVLGEVLSGLERGGVLFFCSAGKDRTGITAALCLSLSGVQREDIVADYMVTAVYNKRGIERRFHEDYAGVTIDQESMDRALSSNASTMEGLLDDFVEMDVASLLDEAGFTHADQGRLASLLCEEIG